MKKNFLSFIILSMTALCSNVNAETSVWDGFSYSFEWYTNSSGSTYHIKTAADLAGLSRCFSQGYYLYGNLSGRTIILDTDIDLGGYEWTPIGTIDANNTYCSFEGTFDGNGHTIKGLSITKTNNNEYIKYAGLFGYSIDEAFTVKNLSVEGVIDLKNVALYSSLDVGGIVGCMNGTIDNCRSNVSINIETVSGEFGKANCGGIAGSIYEGNQVSNCTKCYSCGEMNVSINNSNDANVGGIVGNIYNSNAIISNTASEIEMTIIGGRMTLIGGIIGKSTCKNVKDALFAGSIELLYPNYGLVGGIVGSTSNKISSCIVTANISKQWGTAYLSAISGVNSNSLIVDNCFYLSGIPNNNSYGNEVSESELKISKAFDGFDTSVWSFVQGEYPSLFIMKVEYTISVPVDNGRISFCVNKGSSAAIRLDADENWQLKAFYVDGNDYTVYLSNGRYTFSSVDSNHVISAVYEKDASGIRMVGNENSPQIMIVDRNTIEVENIINKTGIKVFDLNGKIILSKSITSATKINLKTGLYIIKVGERTFKVSL